MRLQVLSRMQNRRPATSKGRRWELLHSLWIGWTFALGFFSWLAFVYIGLRTRHSKWALCAVLYATPLILLLVFRPTSGGWLANLTVSATLALGVVSIVHAFLVRKEYLLRLELLQRETSSVSVTSRGRRWELFHSLWVGWTFTLGLFSWVAFFYIGLRARRIRWVLWGLLYFVVFMLFAVPNGNDPDSEIARATVGPMIVAGFISVVHAFLVRTDYLLRLENRMQEAAETDARLRRRLEGEYRLGAEESPQSESPEQPEPSGSPATGGGSEEPDTHEKAATSPPNAAPAFAPVEAKVSSGSATDGPLHRDPILDTYPLPIAFSWALLASLRDPRDRYREQLRHAENMVTFLGSLSLALLEKQDYKEAQINPKRLWGTGSTFGSWNRVVQGSSKVFRKYEDNPLASAIQKLGVDSPEESRFGADVAALIRARNDYSHGRGPSIEEEVVVASKEAQERLERCMKTLSFLAQYPIRLIQDFDLDRSSGEFWLKCLRLSGDGPGFSQEEVLSRTAFPNGELLLDLGDQNWVPLYPFIIASNCPHCRYRETYFIDRWNDRESTSLMKSFERGHLEERSDVSESLATLTSEH